MLIVDYFLELDLQIIFFFPYFLIFLYGIVIIFKIKSIFNYTSNIYEYSWNKNINNIINRWNENCFPNHSYLPHLLPVNSQGSCWELDEILEEALKTHANTITTSHMWLFKLVKNGILKIHFFRHTRNVLRAQ